MADWSKPALASTYANLVTETNARDTDLAVGFDPAVVTPTNFPTNAIRWRAAANKWEKWNGTTWGDLSSLYAINISGNAANVTGVIAPANGGTGQSSYTVGDLIYASGAAALSKLSAVATGNVLLSGGVATAPSWGKVALTTHVSGTLGVGNGGTGVATLTGVAYGNGVGAFTAATAAQLVAAIGTTPVANATNATTAANGGVTSVNGQTGAVTVSSGVTSVNGNVGDITAAQLAAALKLVASGSAPLYACRAWVNFNGATGAIRASENVSSVTRYGAGDYRIAFTTAMIDANYCVELTGSATQTDSNARGISLDSADPPSVSGVRFQHRYSNKVDAIYCCVAIFR